MKKLTIVSHFFSVILGKTWKTAQYQMKLKDHISDLGFWKKKPNCQNQDLQQRNLLKLMHDFLVDNILFPFLEKKNNVVVFYDVNGLMECLNLKNRI